MTMEAQVNVWPSYWVEISQCRKKLGKIPTNIHLDHLKHRLDTLSSVFHYNSTR